MKAAAVIRALPVVALAVGLAGCEEEPKKEEAASKASAKPATTAAVPTAVPSAPPPEPAVKKPSYDCPEGSEGEGTFEKPCKAEGDARIMEVTWNGKIKDKGPVFKVQSKSDHQIEYGRVVVYFYDGAGKQIEVGSGGKKKSFLNCGGNIFGATVKPEEKFFVNFSCAKKKDVPEDAKAIEAEVRMVGFVGEDGEVDTYWRNEDLVPKDRPKGGVKAKKK